MTADLGDMDRIHALLNCAYADYSIPGYVRSFRMQRVTALSRILSEPIEFEANGSETDVEAFLKSTRSLCDRIAPPAERFDQGFETCDLLAFALTRMANCSPLEFPCLQILQVIQRRFEVNHRLFTRYDGSVRRVSHDYVDMRVYCLASMVFIGLFLHHRHYTYLNTAVKLNDLILKSDWPLAPADLPLVRAAVFLEQKIIMVQDESTNF